MPTLPIEVLRLRVKRARELGLEYKTYASLRAATGHDVVAFRFSSNARRISAGQPGMPLDRAVRPAPLACPGLALAQAMPPALIVQENPDLVDEDLQACLGLRAGSDRLGTDLSHPRRGVT